MTPYAKQVLAATVASSKVRPLAVGLEQTLFECAKEIERLETERDAALAALRDLVNCDDMLIRLRSLHERGCGTDYEDYYRLLPIAWRNARAAIVRAAAEMEPK